jgi:hypothetical protein
MTCVIAIRATSRATKRRSWSNWQHLKRLGEAEQAPPTPDSDVSGRAYQPSVLCVRGGFVRFPTAGSGMNSRTS